MEVNNYLKKIKLVLEYVFKGKIVLNENHQEKLLKFLEDCDENRPGQLILDTPFISDLILQELKNIDNASTSVKELLIRILTILFKNELQFSKMQGSGAFFCHLCIFRNLDSIPPPNLHLACIKLATVQITHRSGLKMAIELKVWKNILYPNIHHRPKPISNAAYNFMARLIWKLNECDSEPELLEVIGYLVEPIIYSGYFKILVFDADTDSELCDKVFSHMSALLAVLSEEDFWKSPRNKVISILKNHFIIHHRLFEIYIRTRNQCLLKLLNTCLFRVSFVLLGPTLYRNQTADFCNKMAATYRNVLVYAIRKRDAFTLVDYVIQSNVIWSQFEKSHATQFNFPLTFERNGQRFEFSLQILIHLLVPILKYSELHRISNQVRMTDAIEQFIVKLGKTVTDYIYSCTYLFGSLFEQGDASYRKKVTTHTLKELLRLKGHISESQVGPIFQSLYFLLEIFILGDGTGGLVVNENSMDQDDLRMLSHLLDAMTMILKEHTISWYENVEIVSVQANLLNLIMLSFLTTKHVVQVLDLINICVKKFTSPNMSLLIETSGQQDSTLNVIGSVIKLYVQHEDWEVRDSALNLLNSCTEISFIKYIPLRTVIRENNLLILAARAALTDPEFYSQCTALKCLSAATKIDSIWQEILVDNEHIYIQLIYILKNHGEGMVRKEAVNVLTGVYTNVKITANFQNTLYEVMLAAALDDLHWEVQLAALNFWKSAIHNNLTDRGMLDGKFPSVTFSKEKRKIILLNNREIQRQLTGMMDHLSSVGCLTALLECMNEINHIDVIDQAHCIAKELVKMLDEYNFEIAIESVKVEQVEVSPKYMVEDINMPMDLSRPSSEKERNEVMDSIFSVDLSEHIICLHDNSNRTKSEEMGIGFSYCPRRELVKADQFLEALRRNNSVTIQEKNNCNADCVNTLNELLDDILSLSLNCNS